MKKLLIAITIVALVYPIHTAQAGILDDIQNGAVCFGTRWLANWVANTIADGIRERVEGAIDDALRDEVPVDDKKIRDNTKSIKKDAQKQTAKERNLDLLARCAARTFFDKEVLGILNIAKKNGRDGGPAYVRNWRNFQTNAQYRGEGIFRSILANTQLCNYLAKGVKDTFGITAKDKISLKGQNIRVGNNDPFTLRGKCTLPSNFDLAKYQKDFAGNGGWAAFERLLQPQNNPYGLALAAFDEQNKQRELESSADINEVIANRGYQGVRGNTAQDSCSIRDKNGKCLLYKDIKLPGDYIGGSLEVTVNQELAWLTNADELNEVIVKLSTRLANRMLNFDKDEAPPTYEGDLSGGPVSPVPTGTGSPPSDPSCTGGNPLCKCVKDDPAYEKYSQGVSAAEDRAIEQRPDLFEIGGRGEIRLRPGVSPATARGVICGAFSMPGVSVCRAHALGIEDELTLEATSPREDIAVDFLVSDGSLWANPTAACQPGVH